MASKRNMRKEYDEYHGKPEQIARRAQRNKARAAAEKAGTVSKGDGKHVHHVGASRTGRLDNTKTKVTSKKANLKIQPKRT